MKISILTCSYNNLEGVKAVVAEVRRQSTEAGSRRTDIRNSADPAEDTHPFTVEHILLDGGSTDGSAEWLEGECEHRTSNIEHATSKYQMKWVSEPDQGLYDALNKGLRMATGEVIGILHTDDILEPGVLERVVNAFQAQLPVAGCRFPVADDVTDNRELKTDNFPDGIYGDLFYVDAADITKVKRVWRSGSYDRRKWWNGWMPPHPALFVTRDLVERVGDYRLDLGSAADYEWMLRAALVHDANFVYINDVEQKGSARVSATAKGVSPCHCACSPLKMTESENATMHGLTPFVRMRTGGQSNVSAGARLKANAADRRAWELNGLKPRPWTLWLKPLRKLGQWVAAWHT